MKRIIIGLMVWLAAGFTIAPVAYAAPPSNISQTVGVCNPNYPQRCIAVAADGSIPVTGSAASNLSVGTNNATAPTSSTEVGIIDGTGKLQGVSSTNPLPITGTINASSTATATVAAPAYTEAQVAPFSQNLTGDLRTISKQSGTWTNTVTQATAASLNATVVGTGTFAVQNSASSAGAAAATTATIGDLTQGLVSTAAPTYTTAQRDPLSLTTAGGLRIDGSGATQPISAASNTIVDGAITTLGTSTDVAASSGVGTATAIALLKAQLIAQQSTAPVSVKVDQTTPGTTNGVQINAALPAGTALVGKVGLDQTTPGTTNAVSIAQIGATTVVNGGVAGSLAVGGNSANNATLTGNPLAQGCQAASAEPTLATNGQGAYVACDLAHKQIVAPYANPENLVSGTTAAMTGTTSTSLVAAPGSGLRNYITNLTCVNSHATVGTFITIQDGSGGTALYTLAAASVFGGSVVSLPAPLRQPTTNTALFVADVTTGANVICSASGYKGQ